MDQYSYIRTAVRVYKKGIRELSKETGHSRVTIRKVLSEEHGGYAPRQRQSYPALDGYLKIIDGWLESDKGVPRKQRHTARRIYHRLVNEHGYGGSEEAVRRYVRLSKPRIGLDGPEVFVVTDPDCGREAEVDWGRAGAIIRGHKTSIYYFCMRSRFSGKPFVRAYPCEKQQAFFDGHIRAFEFFGGVFPTLVYDNLKSAVQKILSGRGRIEQESFLRFRAYYTFAPRFCNAGCGHEKGGTEGLVGYARRNFLVPVPVVDSLEELNDKLLEECIRYGDHRIAGREDTVRVLFEKERDHLLALPAVPFTNVRLVEAKMDHYGTIIADKNRYSVPSGYRGLKIRGELTVDQVDLFYAGKRIAHHERVFGNNKWVLDPDHYLGILQRKPGAFDTARVIRQWRATWPEDLERLLLRFKESQGETKGIKDFITVLMLYRQYDAREVEAAVSLVLERGVHHSSGVKQLLLQTGPEETFEPLKDWPVTPTHDVSVYGQLGGVL
ncbi:MAG: IS21 family transposase [Candidatus Neomarinimicrobiota bacterium]|nr:IS21 family transposase [Smithellaceae bacterium]